ncbi:MAG TPA: cupredoxin domain-containing protein [Acidimicrobiales bacterium]|jgi:plastocyanin|nr:cupredoxin domain-containing protein [Acidimicrobiales bacterium]
MAVANNSRLRRTVAGAALAALALAGCSGQTSHSAIAASIVNGKAGFTPHTISVHKNDKVDLLVTNTTDKTHGFDIEGYHISRVIDPTAPPVHVKFTASQAGTFRIFCHLHPTHQTATLFVE